MFSIVFETLRSLGFGAAAQADIPDDRCVACDSTDLTFLADRAYLCNQCGYEGGSGLAELQEAAQREVWASWSPQERLASARRDLEEAATLALSAQGSLRGATDTQVHDGIGYGNDRHYDNHDEQQSLLLRGLGFMAEAKARLESAQAKIGTGVEVVDTPDVGPVMWTLSIHMTGPLADLMGVNHIREAKAALEQIIDAVDEARDALRAQ